MIRTTTATFMAAAALLGAALLTPAPARAADGAEYVVTFTRTWTAATHPYEYPAAGLLTGPHFSGLIGAAHNGDYMLYAEGEPPTAGLERLSEEGKHSPLDAEIRSAVGAGKACALFETGPIRDVARTETTTVRVSDACPMVSAVAMIAPSPDWFAGAANVDLKAGGRWAETMTVELYPWDSGGDDGTTYTAADRDTQPKKPAMRAGTPHFAINGHTAPVGTLTFTRQH